MNRPKCGPYAKTRLLQPPNPSGICQCGECGLTTSLATMSNVAIGNIAGEHVRFIAGHRRKGRRPLYASVKHLVPPNPSGLCWCGCKGMTKRARQSEAARGKVKGEYVRYIKNHHGKAEVEYIVEDRGHLTPCWIWQLYRDKDGYGKTTVNGRPDYAHRRYYEERYGKIPEGLQIDHLCFQEPCVNPDHMETVTPQVNTARRTEQQRRVWEEAQGSLLAPPVA